MKATPASTRDTCPAAPPRAEAHAVSRKRTGALSLCFGHWQRKRVHLEARVAGDHFAVKGPKGRGDGRDFVHDGAQTGVLVEDDLCGEKTSDEKK